VKKEESKYLVVFASGTEVTREAMAEKYKVSTEEGKKL
jgi:hypothetical protein